MAVLFIGGSILDYSSLVNRIDVSNSSTYTRSAFQRSAIVVPGGSTPLSNFAVGDFDTASSNFWLTHRTYFEYNETDTEAGRKAIQSPYMVFLNGNTKLFGLFNLGGVTVMKRYVNDAVSTTAYDAAMLPGWRNVNLYKTDINIKLSGATSTLKIYQNNELVLSYTGDFASGVTSINKVYFACSQASVNQYYSYSEVFAMERDTRTMALKVHQPTVTRPDNQWAGAATDVSTDDYRQTATVMSTPTPDLAASLATESLPTGNYRVRAVKVSAIVARGETGPTGVQLGVAALPTYTNRATVGAHTFWRLVVLRTRGGDPASSSACLHRLQFYDTLYEASVPPVSVSGTGSNPAAAFMIASPSQFWQSKEPAGSPNFVAARFDTPITVSGVGYRTIPSYGPTSINNNPVQLRLDYSDDGSAWTTAWTTAQYSDPGNTDFDFPLLADPALVRQPVYGPLKSPDLTFTKVGTTFEVNPLTGQPWKGEDINTMGIYLKSKA